jgi:hypothetical protein
VEAGVADEAVEEDEVVLLGLPVLTAYHHIRMRRHRLSYL